MTASRKLGLVALERVGRWELSVCELQTQPNQHVFELENDDVYLEFSLASVRSLRSLNDLLDQPHSSCESSIELGMIGDGPVVATRDTEFPDRLVVRAQSP